MTVVVVEADVLRLFVSQASFLAGSKRRQLGFDKTLKKAMLHNDVDDTLAMSWSDDSLQCLLAGSQVISGTKTFSAAPKLNDNISLQLGTSAGGTLKNSGIDTTLNESVGDLILNGVGAVRIKHNGVEKLQVDLSGTIASGDVKLKDNVLLSLGTAVEGSLSSDGTDVTLETGSGVDAIINSGGYVILKSGGTQILKLEPSGAGLLDDINLYLGTNKNGRLSHDGTHTTLAETNNNLILDSGSAVVLRSGSNEVLAVDSSGVNIRSGYHLILGNAYAGGAPTPDGYIEIYDVNGKLLRVPVYDAAP